ncbi:glucan endo-1,3-beta-glucosidase-like [Typha latifolia]|uniref:glucan endo-1,3-beta-glucosidase-like n=1 Tax=Typha latifolia TaxID=4733 RepID=UPI003C2D7FD2
MALVAIQLLLGVLLLLLLLAAIPTNVHSIGVCYGMLGDNLPQPSEVIKMYQSNGITAMRIYGPNKDVLEALRGTDIQVMVGVPNQDLRSFASDPSAAVSWVETNVLPYSDVSFRYIAVGNEVISNAEPTARADEPYVLPAMENVYAALSSVDLHRQIKVSTAVFQRVLGKSFPPSVTEFSSEAAAYMVPIVKFLADKGAPLLANVYTYFPYIYAKGQIDIGYALFKPESPVVVYDEQYQYHNLFDASVDAFYAALEKVGGGNVEVVVTESGWPSKGDDAATLDNAGTYVQNLVRHVGSNGTPRRPGKTIEAYIFAMFNENQKGKPEEETERNFGLFYPDQSPVYPINFN